MMVISTEHSQKCHHLSNRAWNYILYHTEKNNYFCYQFYSILQNDHNVGINLALMSQEQLLLFLYSLRQYLLSGILS